MIRYFTDPMLYAPTIGCMAMCLVCSLIGVLIFVKKESLLGETLSHAAYPGIMLAALLTLIPHLKVSLTLCILFGSALFSLLALKFLELCRGRLKMNEDSSLTFVLTSFFGLGLTLASLLQTVQSRLYKQALVFLFGQATTITDFHMTLSLALAAIVTLLLIGFYREIQISHFDWVFARSVGIRSKWIHLLTYFILVASIVVGIRSIGLFLLSGMFIAPAIAARQWTHRLSKLFILSGAMGLTSGYLGIFFSNECSAAFASRGISLSFATGPMIILTSSMIAIFSLLFAPKQGWILRGVKVLRFKFRRLQENILKTLWHLSEHDPGGVLSKNVWGYQGVPFLFFVVVTKYMCIKGDLERHKTRLKLSAFGKAKAQNIVRLHRLWELYLVHIGVGKEKVHHNAEEMEHIITPQIEEKLLKMMKHPTVDPHNKPIPSSGRVLSGRSV